MAAGSYDVEGHGEKCVERYCELASTNVEQTNHVSTPGVHHRTRHSKRKRSLMSEKQLIEEIGTGPPNAQSCRNQNKDEHQRQEPDHEIRPDPFIQMKFVDTHLADVLTVGSFTRVKWNRLIRLFNLMDETSLHCIHLLAFFCH